MNLSIDISADLQSRLLQEAAKRGIDPGQYVAEAVRGRLEEEGEQAAHLDVEQSRLLTEINQGLSQTEWDRYYQLAAKRQQEALTGEELDELVAATKRIESLNARRIECLAKLARLRGTTLPELLEQLELAPPPVM